MITSCLSLPSSPTYPLSFLLISFSHSPQKRRVTNRISKMNPRPPVPSAFKKDFPNCTSRPSAEPDKEAGWLNKCKNIVLAVKMTEPTSCQNNISCSQRNNHNKISNSPAPCPTLNSDKDHKPPWPCCENFLDVNSCDVNSWSISSECTITLLTKS